MAVVVLLKRVVEAVGPAAVTAPCRLAPLVHAAIRTVVGAATVGAAPPAAADAAGSPAGGVGGSAGGNGGGAAGGAASVPSAAHLLEDALDLWAAAVRHAPAYTPDLDRLAAALPALAGGDGDALRPALGLVDAYAVLGGDAFRAAHGAAVVGALRSALGGVRERGVLAILDVVDTLLAVWPPAAVGALVPLLGAALRPVLAARGGGGGTGRGARPPSGVVAAAAAASALRLAAASPAAFSAALAAAVAPSAAAPAAGGSPAAAAVGAPPPSEEAALAAFLDVAATHLDIMFTARRRRVAVAGWVTLLAAAPASTALLGALPALVDAVVQVLADGQPPSAASAGGDGADGGGGGGDWANVVARNGEGADGAPDGDGGDGGEWDPPAAAAATPDDTRRAALAAADDAIASRLGAAAASAVAAAVAAAGADAVAAALGRLDPRVRQQAQGWLAPM